MENQNQNPLENQIFTKEIPPENTQTVEVELASAWERIGAYVLNNLFSLIAAMPMIGSIIAAAMQFSQKGGNEADMFAAMFGGWFWLGLLIYCAFGVYQIYLMSKHGQSLGKKMLNLRVIRTNGEDAGFVNVVLLREVVFNIAIGVCAGILGLLGEMGDVLGGLLQFVVSLACLIMLFAHSERRTLQDLIGDTVVIKLPRK